MTLFWAASLWWFHSASIRRHCWRTWASTTLSRHLWMVMHILYSDPHTVTLLLFVLTDNYKVKGVQCSSHHPALPQCFALCLHEYHEWNNIRYIQCFIHAGHIHIVSLLFTLLLWGSSNCCPWLQIWFNPTMLINHLFWQPFAQRCDKNK